jgi:hypothetical protein
VAIEPLGRTLIALKPKKRARLARSLLLQGVGDLEQQLAMLPAPGQAPPIS